MDTFGGSLKGLSGGANNPLIISALVGGGWTTTGAPEPFNWILHIQDVTPTFNTAGSGCAGQTSWTSSTAKDDS